MESIIFRDLIPCGLVEVQQHFGRMLANIYQSTKHHIREESIHQCQKGQVDRIMKDHKVTQLPNFRNDEYMVRHCRVLENIKREQDLYRIPSTLKAATYDITPSR
jgi:hypothetical protein